MRTQWRMGPAGPVGLDYLAAYPLLDRQHRGSADAWNEAFADLRVMEAAALNEMRKAP